MCDARKGCQKPQELKGAPEDCSRERIRKCHGDVAQRPCTTGCEKPEKLKAAGLEPATSRPPVWQRAVISVYGIASYELDGMPY